MLYTENPLGCHEESIRFFFRGEIDGPISESDFRESIGFSRSIEDSDLNEFNLDFDIPSNVVENDLSV
jgi:hypothetical protein